MRPVSRVGSLRLRSDFERLRKQGMTVRSGNVRVRYAAPARSGTADELGSPTRVPADRRVAFAIGKKTGKAVLRNRFRRQLRAIFREAAVENPELLPAGDYLIRVTAPENSYDQLKRDVIKALNQLQEPAKTGS